MSFLVAPFKTLRANSYQSKLAEITPFGPLFRAGHRDEDRFKTIPGLTMAFAASLGQHYDSNLEPKKLTVPF
jgi:hypothetical protein